MLSLQLLKFSRFFLKLGQETKSTVLSVVYVSGRRYTNYRRIPIGESQSGFFCFSKVEGGKVPFGGVVIVKRNTEELLTPLCNSDKAPKLH